MEKYLSLGGKLFGRFLFKARFLKDSFIYLLESQSTREGMTQEKKEKKKKTAAGSLLIIPNA